LEVAQRNAARHHVADRVQFVESNLLHEAGADFVGPQHAAHPLGKVVDAEKPVVANHHAKHPPITSHRSPLFDLIASNPPYIGRGEEGYELYADLMAQAAEQLKPTGILVLELGHDTLRAVQPLLDAANWINVGVTNDLAGIPRVIAAERK
jgi:methylase of polypeptide subunit release factors